MQEKVFPLSCLAVVRDSKKKSQNPLLGGCSSDTQESRHRWEEQPDRDEGGRKEVEAVTKPRDCTVPAVSVPRARGEVGLSEFSTSPWALTQHPEPLLPRLSRRLLHIFSHWESPALLLSLLPAPSHLFPLGKPSPAQLLTPKAGGANPPELSDSWFQQTHGMY